MRGKVLEEPQLVPSVHKSKSNLAIVLPMMLQRKAMICQKGR